MKKLDKVFEFETKSNLKVEFYSKNISLKVIGWENETSELQVKFELEQAGNKEINIEKIVETDFNPKENKLNIKINVPKDVKIKHAELILKVPTLTEINSEIKNGAISVQNLFGNQMLHTVNGAIKLDHVNGNMICKTENGATKIIECKGDADIFTENGAIKMIKCDGALKLKSKNGVIKIVESKGILKLEHKNGMIRILDAGFEKAEIINENGGIYYEFNPIEKGNFRFENNNGKVHLVIPEEIPYKIEARNRMGKFHVGLQGNYERHQEGNEQILKMIKGSGNVNISARNRMGSILLVNSKGKTKSFNFSFVGDIFDKTLDKIPEEYREQARKGFNKAKAKLKKINVPDINSIVSEVITDIQHECQNVQDTFSTDEFKEKAEEEIAKVIDKVKEKVRNKELSEQEKEMVNERSRLKILQMLQDGKITADEAERLIKVMEKQNG